MSSSLALLRASAVIPLEIWLHAHGRPTAALFVEAGLPPSPAAVPHRLVSLWAFIDLVVRLAEAEGPDFGLRLTSPEALMRLETPWRAIRTSSTIREALLKISRTFHWHSPNVFFLVKPVAGGVEVTEAATHLGSDLELHQVHQHFAGFVSCIGELALQQPLPASFFIRPHPAAGVEHLKTRLGPDVHAAHDRRLLIRIADAVLDRAFPWHPEPDSQMTAPDDPVRLSSLSDSLRLLVAGMVQDGHPGLDRLARSIGRSRRTLQRLLADEGTSYAALLDSVRREQALRQLDEPGTPIAAIAREVGYRQASSLSRAMRRWADDSPRRLRKASSGH